MQITYRACTEMGRNFTKKKVKLEKIRKRTYFFIYFALIEHITARQLRNIQMHTYEINRNLSRETRFMDKINNSTKSNRRTGVERKI